MKKKILPSLVLLCLSIFVLGAIEVSAAYVVSDGEINGYGAYGNGVKWEYYSDRTLVISNPQNGRWGWFYGGVTGRPWPSDIKKLVFEEGIHNIGNYAFEDCDSLEEIYFSPDMSIIDRDVFKGCNNIKKIHIKSLENYLNITYADNSSHKLNPLDGAGLYLNDKIINDLVIPDGTTKISAYALYGCNSIQTIVIPNSLNTIYWSAFRNLKNLKTIYYNGTEDDFKKIQIENVSDIAKDKIVYFYYVTIANENGKKLSTLKNELGAIFDKSQYEKVGYSLNLYTDEELKKEFASTMPITENTTLYLKYTPNKYNAKFVDEDGTVIREGLVDYGAQIVPPKSPTKPRTQQYTYTFDGWDGFYDGITQTNSEMVFIAQYSATINQYTYKFIDDDGTILKTATVDYGTIIELPEKPDDKDPYTFDYWENYTDGMTLTDDIEFTAVYKYKDYIITVTGLENPVTVTYNSSFNIEPQKIDDYHYFIAYFTEPDGKSVQITNNKGESLKPYDVIGDLTVYPYFYSGYMNKIEIQGDNTAMPGDKIKQKAVFATDKPAKYFVATVKYPEYLTVREINNVDFADKSKDSIKTEGGFNYMDITCVYSYKNENMPINKNLTPFEIVFDVATATPLRNADVTIENVLLIGDNNYSITDTNGNTIQIMPKLAESVEIIGESNIDKITGYTAVVYPDYTTNKDIVWSVDDSTVASISQDGTLTPHKNGVVTITATAQDGSERFASKKVNVTAYATISSLKYNNDTSINLVPDKYEYIICVNKDTESISLTPTFVYGKLSSNGSGIWISGRTKRFELNDIETVIRLNISNVDDMTDSEYKITVIKCDGTKAIVSEDGKTFTIKPINIEKDNAVILALYNGDKYIDIQSSIFDGADITFTTDKAYTNAKVMVWSDLTSLKPISDVIEVEATKPSPISE